MGYEKLASAIFDIEVREGFISDEEIEEHLRKIPKDYATILRNIYVIGVPVDEIARNLLVRTETIKSLEYMALQKLRNVFYKD